MLDQGDGLRQLLYEPEHRVYIGPTPPLYHDQARVISAVRLSNCAGWFDSPELCLNSGLVSVIGQKGSGKSALAEIIAYAAGSWVGEAGGFLKRAGRHLGQLAVELHWGDGAVSTIKLGQDQPPEPKVRYLSQKFVERLCAEDHIGSELVREIEAVIFSYIDPADTLNASSFGELRGLRTAGIKAEADRLREDIVRLIRADMALRDAAAKLPDKKARIKTLTEEREGLAKQMPKAASAEEAKVQAQLQEKRIALTTAQQSSAREKQGQQKISDIRTRIVAFTAEMKRFTKEIDTELGEAGIPKGDWGVYHPAFPGDTEPPLKARMAALEKSVTDRLGAALEPAEGTIRWLQAQMDELTKRETADKARQEKIKTIQTRTAAIDIEVERLNNEIVQIEGSDKAEIATIRDERNKSYVAYFRNLKSEQAMLKSLYAPVAAKLKSDSSSAQEQALEFSIRWGADMQKWLERGTSLFDKRSAIPYGNEQGLVDAANEILAPAWMSGDPDRIGTALGEFLVEFRKLHPNSYLRTGVTVQDVFEWLYEVEHISLSYGLKYNGVELENLSPGTKGIVLLILYLGMDLNDTRPLIVDQPDENLDNESIYELLTSYFKSAKSRRQIILITHNPNLVVNADSEQVIVATCGRQENALPHITYRTGALENSAADDSGIQQQVCRILEGGLDAFRKREKRYSLGTAAA